MKTRNRHRAAFVTVAIALLMVAIGDVDPVLAQTTSSTQPTRVTTTTSTTTSTTTTTTTAVATTTTAKPVTTTTAKKPTTTTGGGTTSSTAAPGSTTTFGSGNPTTTPGVISGGDVTSAELAVKDFEVTQGMQNLANDMPLVTGRTTIARVYVKTAQGDAAGVRGVMGAWIGNKFLGTVVAANQPITAHVNGGKRVNTNDSLYFLLPPSWVKTGETKLRVFLYQSSIAFTEKNEKNLGDNFRTQFVKFNKAAPLRIVMPPLHLHLPENSFGADNTYYVLQNLGSIASVTEAAKRYFPIGEYQIFAPQTPLFPSNHAIGTEWDLGETKAQDAGNRLVPLATVLSAKTASNQNSWQWYTMIKPGQPYSRWNVSNGTISGVGGSSSNKVSQGIMTDTFSASNPWSHSGGGTIAHELTHNLGQAHVNCAGTEALGGGIDANFPTPAPNCSLAVVKTNGYYGFDVLYQAFPGIPEPIAISNQPGVGAPNEAYPLMSYQGPAYTDPYSWCKLLNQFGVTCNSYEKASGPKLGALANAKLIAETSGGLAVRAGGLVNRDSGTARLLEVAVRDDLPAVEAEKVEAAEGAVFKVQALDASGAVVGERVVNSHDDAAHAEEPDPAFVFLEVIPVTSRPTTVRITRDGQPIATRTASTAPTVKLVSPNGGESLDGDVPVKWEAVDADGGPLDIELSYSADDGKTWRVLTSGLGGSSTVIPAADLGGSTTGRLRVAVNDGFSSAVDASDAAFSVANQGPNLALIVSPGANRVFRLHDTVVLRGSVSDWEDANVTNLTWSSDRDGQLGRGTEVQTSKLTAGSHVITMTATDSGGASAKSTVTIEIDGSRLADQPSALELAAASKLLQNEGGSDGSPLLPIAGGVVVLAAVIGGVLLLRRRSAS